MLKPYLRVCRGVSKLNLPGDIGCFQFLRSACGCRSGTRPASAPKARALRTAWLQSRGGLLHLPLFQNGACLFPCTPLLSILMLVTHTWREIVPMLPRFRIVAMSMERLQIAVARIAAVPIDMIHLELVIMLEEHPAGATAPVLRFEQFGHSRTGVRMPSLADTPVHPVAIVRTAVARDLHMPGNRHRLMRVEIDGLRASGRRRKGPTGADPMPNTAQLPIRWTWSGVVGVPSGGA
jgi:hypothetical protein